MSRTSHFAAGLAAALVLPLILAAAALSPAAASEFEISTFAAVRDGGASFQTGIACVAVVGIECPSYGTLDDSRRDAWGLAAALRVHGPWWAELRWSEEDAGDVLFFEDRELTDPAPGRGSFEIEHLHAGVLYRFFDERRWSPFVTAFAGLSRVESDSPTPDQGALDVERTSGGLGAGALVDLGAHLGIRIEARALWIDLPRNVFFDEHLEQLEGTAQLRYRF